MQESVEEEKMNVISGRKCSESYRKSGPLGSLVRTLLVSPLWSKEGYSLRWERKGLCSEKVTSFTDTNSSSPSPSNGSAEILNVSDIPSSRCLFLLRLSEHPTGETGSSSLPVIMRTPSANDCKGREYASYSGGGTLSQEIVQNPKYRDLLPTPTAGEAEKYRLQYTPGSQMGMSLSAMGASGLLPTPIAGDWKGQKKGEGKGPERMLCGVIETAAKLLPTPTARDEKNPSSPDGKRIARKLEQGYTIELNDLANMGILPTPRSNNMTDLNLMNPNVADSENGRLEGVIAKSIQTGVLPTPSARDWKGKTNPGIVKEGSGCVYGETLPDTIGRLTQDSSPKTGGGSFRLSPLFTADMMGFHLMWTTLPFLSQSGERNP